MMTLVVRGMFLILEFLVVAGCIAVLLVMAHWLLSLMLDQVWKLLKKKPKRKSRPPVWDWWRKV